ncbi:hypothetical protein JYU34_004558 [Plutella xylostella]|uniref:Uncharacterized protein n=1 Tax=Plutella xylostella TaxID=51655 RepID=A0ABQ7QYA7_PLUXY|nr:hypothetical protein JYU34_004558 [Plutella xylostella]
MNIGPKLNVNLKSLSPSNYRIGPLGPKDNRVDSSEHFHFPIKTDDRVMQMLERDSDLERDGNLHVDVDEGYSIIPYRKQLVDLS